MINKERLLAEFLELVQIDSPTGSEKQIADSLKTRLGALGFEVSEDKAGEILGGNCGNVYGYLKGNILQAPILLLSAHMDTVQPGTGIKPVLKQGVITSVGNTILGADDKSGIAPIMEALRTVKEQAIPHGDIQVVFCIAEEGGVNGSRNLDRVRLKADLGYVLDSGGKPGEIILEAPGQDRLKVTFKGKASHAGVAPEEGINAILAAAKAIASVRQGRIDEETTANVGTIHGGRATNIIADTVEITAESRSRNLAKMEQQTAYMCETFKRCAEELGAEAILELRRAYDPYVISKEAKVSLLAAEAAKKAGFTPVFRSSGGGSDANHLNCYGIPCAVLGTGMKKSHTFEEFIEEEDLYNSARLVLEIIKGVSVMK